MYDFIGTNSFNCADATVLQNLTTKTVLVRTQLDSLTGGNMWLVDKISDSFLGGWLIFVEAQAGRQWLTLLELFSVSGGESHSAQNTISANIPLCLVVTYDNSSDTNGPDMWINGSGQTITPADPPNGTRLSDIGFNQRIGGSGADQKQTEIAIWNVILSPDEIRLLSFSNIKGMPLQVRPDNLVAYWPMDETPNGANASGTGILRDRSRNSNNGTPSGTCTSFAENMVSYV